jgi:hypothetical protein
MTEENEQPETPGLPAAKPEQGENILLNWVIVILGLGAISLVGTYLPDFL